MQLNPSLKPNSCSATQEIPRVLLNPRVQYRVYKSSPLVQNLNQIKPVHIHPSYFFKIGFNIIS
jgi:hypothetical protein